MRIFCWSVRFKTRSQA